MWCYTGAEETSCASTGETPVYPVCLRHEGVETGGENDAVVLFCAALQYAHAVTLEMTFGQWFIINILQRVRKKGVTEVELLSLSLPNVDRFPELFHCET